MKAAVEGGLVSLDALGRVEGGALDDKAVRKVRPSRSSSPVFLGALGSHGSHTC